MQKRSATSVFDCLIIDPDSSYYTVFNEFYLTILALASVVLAAWFACFGFPGLKIYNDPPSITWLWIDSIMEVSFAIDICVNFFVQY